MKTKLTKAQLIALLENIYDVTDGLDDPYANDRECLQKIHDLAAQVCGKKEWFPDYYKI